jgi:ferredoxin
MKRNVIHIDQDKCTGCGDCIPECPEGAIQIIDGKARLVSDLFCDGLGACLGHCPEGAITIEEREAEPYDERRVMENVVRGGENVIIAHLRHLREHRQHEYFQQAVAYLGEKGIPVPVGAVMGPQPGQHPSGCPGMKIVDAREGGDNCRADAAGGTGPAGPSRLRQWPVQLQLLSPNAPYFKEADLLITADCVPFAHAGFHERFLKDRILIILCPKLDTVIEQYIEKLAEILRLNDIKSITVVHMEVPCCFGLMRIIEEALKRSGKNIIVKDYTISIKGEIV